MSCWSTLLDLEGVVCVLFDSILVDDLVLRIGFNAAATDVFFAPTFLCLMAVLRCFDVAIVKMYCALL